MSSIAEATELNVRLFSKLVDYYHDPGISEEVEAEAEFSYLDEDILFKGSICFIPDTVIEPGFPITYQESWGMYDVCDFDEIKEDQFLELISSNSPIDHLIDISSITKEHKLQKHDWLGLSGEFTYYIEATLSIKINQAESPSIREKIAEALVLHFAFYNDERRNSEDHISSDMIEF